MKITKEAYTFYFVFALLKTARKYADYLIQSKAVSFGIKRDMTIINNRILDLEKTAQRSLKDNDANQWQKEWTERDYECMGQVFSAMCDMNENQRGIMEEFSKQLLDGQVKVA